MAKLAAHVALRRFREACGLSLRKAAEQLNVTHPALSSWEGGKSPPDAYRRAIQKWTRGAVMASSWPLSEYEQRVLAVKPARCTSKNVGSSEGAVK